MVSEGRGARSHELGRPVKGLQVHPLLGSPLLDQCAQLIVSLHHHPAVYELPSHRTKLGACTCRSPLFRNHADRHYSEPIGELQHTTPYGSAAARALPVLEWGRTGLGRVTCVVAQPFYGCIPCRKDHKCDSTTLKHATDVFGHDQSNDAQC